MNATDTSLAIPDSPAETPFKQEEKGRSKTHVRSGITKNKCRGQSKTRRTMSRNSRRINRKRG